MTRAPRWRAGTRTRGGRCERGRLGSLAVTGLLLTLTWIVAETTIADPQLHSYPGLTRDATLHDFGFLLYRNGLVLALHALACVAGFIAGSQLPTAAQDYRGLVRKLHEAAGPRRSPSSPPPRCSRSAPRPTRSATTPPRWRSQLGVSPFVLLVALLPHALPELFALFLPLAAWSIASRGVRSTSCWPPPSPRRRSRSPCWCWPRASRPGSLRHPVRHLLSSYIF